MSTALTVQVHDQQTNENWEETYDRFPVRIGRNQLNDLHIERPYVSQFHASIEVADGKIVVKDLGSTNGTVHRGQKLLRDQPIDLTDSPELQIGPVIIRMTLKEIAQRSPIVSSQVSLLDLNTPAGAAILEQRTKPVHPGQEDPFIRQLVPYIEAYRSAWANVYRLIYEHLTRLQQDVRASYLKRLLIEHPSVAQESDFQKVSQYYGVPAWQHGELTPSTASLAALIELSKALMPDSQMPLEVPNLLNFSRHLRDIMTVFLKCFISLRDGYHEFESEVLRKDRYDEQGNRIGSAKDPKELGMALFGEDASPEASHHLHDLFVEVMTHQVALLNGVMEGAKQLLDTLAPKTIERKLEQKGKKGGLFSNKYEGLWEEYQRVHGDYQGEDKETFLIIFGPQFSRAYAATAGEARGLPDRR